MGNQGAVDESDTAGSAMATSILSSYYDSVFGGDMGTPENKPNITYLCNDRMDIQWAVAPAGATSCAKYLVPEILPDGREGKPNGKSWGRL